MGETALSYDDITLIPQFSTIRSRKDPDVCSNIGFFGSRMPIISANMDTVTGHEMAIALWHAGAIGALHRFHLPDFTQATAYQLVRRAGADAFVSLGVHDILDEATLLWDAGARNFIIDIAHGHSILMKDAIQTLRSAFPDAYIVAGNIATSEAVVDLREWGADCVKAGVSCGSICKTRIVTGHGLPMWTTITQCALAADSLGIPLIADGGIKSAGDIVKAFAAGASAVMLGSLFAGCFEAPGEHSFGQKQYRGMASTSAQEDRVNHTAGTAEGVTTMIPRTGPASEILGELIGGLRSGMSYCNARSIDEIFRNAKWIKQSHASYIEGTPHIMRGR